MTKLCDLLGSRAEVMYECMYTKHKTQKRKIWQDGFVTLYASRRLIVYTDDEGKPGKAIDEVKLAPLEWDRKDEEYTETSKFLVEIVNGTPINSSSSRHVEVPNVGSTTQTVSTGIRSTTSSLAFNAGRKPRLFSKPIGSGPLRQTRTGVTVQSGKGYNHNDPSTSKMKAPYSYMNFDPELHPTSEWSYTPDAISRTPDEVLALLEK